MEDYRRCTFSGGGEERNEILPISIEKESIKRAWNIWKVEDSWTRSPNIWGRGGRREEKTRQSFGRCFNGRVRIVRKGWVGKSSQRQLRPRSSSWRAKCFPLWREGGGEGWVGVNGLRKRRRNTIITSPQIYEDREIEIFVPRQARRRHCGALSRSVQNIFNYGIIICCLCRAANARGCYRHRLY